MQKILLAISTLVLCCSHSGCEHTRSDDCDLGFCQDVHILASLSIPHDTLYIGDTLIIHLVVPDSVYRIEEGDTLWEKVKTFEHLWGGYDLNWIDTSAQYKLGNPETAPIILAGGGDESSYDRISKVYPYENKVGFVLKKPGTYFLSTHGDIACKVNGARRRILLDFDVKEKHFDWLEPYIVPNGGTVKELEEYDDKEVKNYYPFRVVEK